MEFIDARRELAKLREYFDASAFEAGITLQLKCETEIGLRANRELFHSAVGNLVSNSIAHTAPGGIISIIARCAGDRTRVEIVDNGSGIVEEHLPRVFDRFYRADAARSNTQSRVGLGLAIVQTIARLHGATVEIHSKIGQGTSVNLDFPGKLVEKLPRQSVEP